MRPEESAWPQFSSKSFLPSILPRTKLPSTAIRLKCLFLHRLMDFYHAVPSAIMLQQRDFAQTPIFQQRLLNGFFFHHHEALNPFTRFCRIFTWFDSARSRSHLLTIFKSSRNSWPEKVQSSRRDIFSSKGTSLPSDAIDFTMDFGLMGWSTSSGHIFPMAQRDVGRSMNLIQPSENVGSGTNFNSKYPYHHCGHNFVISSQNSMCEAHHNLGVPCFCPIQHHELMQQFRTTSRCCF